MVQPIANMDKQHVQQPITTQVPTIVQVTTNLPTYVPKGFVHQPPNGVQLGEPPFNPPIGSYGWLAPYQCMFIPPWYQPPIVQLVLKPTIKLPYKKLQYLTYVKDTNLDAHIKMFKKAIKTNGEMVEVHVINLFGSILRDSISKWGENYVQDHPNYTLKSWGKHFSHDSKL
jgi:hypothetical protein